MDRFGQRSTVLLLIVALVVAVSSPAADAGGSWLYPVEDRYEPGESATMVGYFGGGTFGPINDEPYFAFVQAINETGVALGDQIAVGQLTVSRFESEWRASITFDLPDDLTPGEYFLDYCTAGCEQKMGSLVGGYLWVGTEPTYRVTRSWPADEPEIQNLADNAILVTRMGHEVTAKQLRDGWEPRPTLVPHTDYPPATPTPRSVVIAETKQPGAPATETAMPVAPTPVAPAPTASSTPTFVPTRDVEVAAVALGSVQSNAGSPSALLVLGALATTSAAVLVGRRVLRHRDSSPGT